MFHLRNAARDYEGHLSGTDCRGSWYPIAQLVLFALMSSSCPSPVLLVVLMVGLSRRKNREVVREFREACGLEKSAISEHSSKPAANAPRAIAVSRVYRRARRTIRCSRCVP